MSKKQLSDEELAALLPEDMQLRLLVACGNVFSIPDGEGSSLYWHSVWNMIRETMPEILADPHADYPSSYEGDMDVLSSVYYWQWLKMGSKFPDKEDGSCRQDFREKKSSS